MVARLFAKQHKYRAKPTVVDGVRFASQKEAARWSALKLLERCGNISDLKRQVRFALDVNGIPICHYVCDATYVQDGKLIVEDTKGVLTPEYKLKAKLMFAVHGITILET